ncbi:heterogeneous nuclear ribonucleoprotein U-like protein 1 [Fopius arisanus]|uniref:Heterogeneous nuclear ribonucleoprotein U-like protein 1 n=1 Tax=Fopius arisanus TaxID=64838 RepID=A0A9R1UAM5_9HYME|nr:PREDICTED: heterogeneous nuclear ribonucleoprotein U-like protein 1 [Fopius arisanus]
MDPAKLKVVELRAELSQRGLDTKGNKAVLVERLRKALEESDVEEAEEASPPESPEAPTPKEERPKTPEPSKPPPPARTPARTTRSPRGTPTKAPAKVLSPPPQKQPSPIKSPVIEKPASPVIDKETEAALLEENEPQSGAVPQTAVEELNEPSKSDTCTPQVAEEAPEIPPASQEDSVQQPKQPEVSQSVVASPETPEPTELPEKSVDPTIENTPHELPMEIPQEEKSPEPTNDDIIPSENEDNQTPGDSDEKMDVTEESESNCPEDDKIIPEDVKEEVPEEKPVTSDVQVKEEQEDYQIKTENETNDDVILKPEIKQEDEKEVNDEDRKDRKDRKRKRSTSSDHQKSPPPQAETDDEPEIDYSRVLLSWYDSDLNLVIDRSSFLSATPMHNDGFGYVWAGARASFGFTSGKVYYEVKVKHECSIMLQDEEYPHVLRAGWSAIHTSMQLGEEKLSYGYGGTGKISTGNNFKDYGPKFGLNDVIGCYLDMSGDAAIISYTLNGNNLGEAFKVLKTEFQDKPLFPHILTKNCEFVCNFGDEEPWSGSLEDFVPVGQVDIKERTPGPVRPERREDCEMVMMCGLPAAGKTYWATNYALEHPDKMYNILGTNNLIDKMKVIGLPRRRNYHGRWDVLIDKCTRCLNKLLDVAATRRRNYILDQTNVYPTAQRRKMRYFHGFLRRAIVMVPTEEEFKSRTAKRIAVEGKEVPDSAIMEMKANFRAPVVGDSFDVVEWVELGEEEAKKLIVTYNKEGKDAGFGQQQSAKRPRFEKNSETPRENREVRPNRDTRETRDYRDRRNAYPDKNRNSTWRGGSQMPGGWRDRGPRGGHMRPPGPYGPPGSWRGRGGPPGHMHRPNDRRGAHTDRRGGTDRRGAGAARGGGWGPMNSNYHNSGSSGGWGGSSQGSGGWGSGGQTSGGWTGGQGGWGGQQGGWGSWKGYGSNSNYNQGNYQQGYGNGNWGSWNQQYYNQYWSQPTQASGQSSGQSTPSGASSTTAPSTTSTGSTYNNYPQGWQGYTPSYNYSTDTSNTSVQPQK